MKSYNLNEVFETLKATVPALSNYFSNIDSFDRGEEAYILSRDEIRTNIQESLDSGTAEVMAVSGYTSNNEYSYSYVIEEYSDEHGNIYGHIPCVIIERPLFGEPESVFKCDINITPEEDIKFDLEEVDSFDDSIENDWI